MQRRQFIKLGAGAATIPLVSACASEHSVSIDTSLPVSKFDSNSTAEEVSLGIDLRGKTALVTGCNSGLGFETMRVLALRGAHVLGTGRTLEKAEKACAKVAGDTTPLALELAYFQSVVDCANQAQATLAELNKPLDILICNAGVNFLDFELVNNVEKTFVINHLGHFLLVNHLLPLLAAGRSGRIVHVGSRSAYRSAPNTGIDFENLSGEAARNNYDAGLAYGRSKLANALFSLQLSKELAESTTTSNVIHPGLVKTNIARRAPAFIRGAFDLFGGVIAKTPAQGAATQMYAATNPALAGVSGAYFEDCNPVTIHGPNHVFDDDMAQKLWKVSVEMTGPFLAS
ncbi:MAG: SDR family NAD(P)-dependent oxidoreductase [Pseudomonadales bacterium]